MTDHTTTLSEEEVRNLHDLLGQAQRRALRARLDAMEAEAEVSDLIRAARRIVRAHEPTLPEDSGEDQALGVMS